MKPIVTLLLVASLAGNIALAIYSYKMGTKLTEVTVATDPAILATRPASAQSAANGADSTAAGEPGSPRANVTAGQWRAPRSEEDMRQVITGLRAAGYPPSILRAVTDQMLREHFADREPYAKRNFWNRFRSTPESVAEQIALNREREELREQLLGADGSPAASMTAQERARRFGNISDEKINALMKLDREYNDIRSMSDAARDPNVSGRERYEQQRSLEEEKRADLVALLSPEELAEYDMRNSRSAQRVINSLLDIDLSESEYVQLYQAQKAVDDANPSRAELGSGAESMINRMVAQTEFNEQARAVLGDDRFFKYLENSDGTYAQIARFAANQPGMTQDKAYQVYQLQQEMMATMFARNTGRRGPPSSEQMAEIRATQEAYNARLQQLIGVEAAQAYQQQPFGRTFAPMRAGPAGGQIPPGATPPVALPGSGGW